MMPPLPPTIDIGALARYLDGTASPEDRADVEAWIGSDPTRRAAVTTLQTAWDADAQPLGEAYLSVVHDAARPFVVHAAGGAIQEIGTRFGVHAYGDAERERVAVVEGAVALAGTPLRAGQVATLSRTGTIRVLRNARVADELAWTRGRLVFTNVPLEEVAERSEEHTSELQSRPHLVCRLLLEKKKIDKRKLKSHKAN